MSARPAQMEFDHLRFPGKAGEAQRAGDKRALVRELGSSYRQYHDFLRKQLAELGGRPGTEGHTSLDSFLNAWERVEEVVHAEALLRRCVGAVRHGKGLDEPLAPGPPLIDELDQLVALE